MCRLVELLMRAPSHHPDNATQRGINFPDGVPFPRRCIATYGGFMNFHRHHWTDWSRQADSLNLHRIFVMNICFVEHLSP